MAGVQITAPVRSYERVLRRLVGDGFASRLASRDASLWGRAAASEAGKRLAWVDLAHTSRPLLARIAALREHHLAAGRDRIVLCGMGGSSLAPEVICAAAGVELTVLDSSQPDMVRTALAERLAGTVVVVASKSGGTVETDSQRRAYEHAFIEAGLNPVEHMVVVTDPGSPLDEDASSLGYEVFRADPDVGGRYSALTAFGLVPSGLAGAPIETLLDEAAAVHEEFLTDAVENVALRLGALLGVAADNDVDKVVIAECTGTGSAGWGLGDWIEQLVAESTGKIGRGVLPVVVPAEDAVNFDPATTDSVLVALGAGQAPTAPSGYAAAIDLPLGAQMLLWEIATAVAGQIIGINPFDQPDVESAKKAARELLGGGDDPVEPDFTDDGIAVVGSTAGTLEGAIDELLEKLDPAAGYLAIQAYLDRWGQADFAVVRESLAARTGRPVTFGWGPRFLHSTGQYHKGGTPTGVFVQITADPIEDLAVPGRDFTFGSFIASQAAGDAQVLRSTDRPLLHLHLTDLGSGLERLRRALA